MYGWETSTRRRPHHCSILCNCNIILLNKCVRKKLYIETLSNLIAYNMHTICSFTSYMGTLIKVSYLIWSGGPKDYRVVTCHGVIIKWSDGSLYVGNCHIFGSLIHSDYSRSFFLIFQEVQKVCSNNFWVPIHPGYHHPKDFSRETRKKIVMHVVIQQSLVIQYYIIHGFV